MARIFSVLAVIAVLLLAANFVVGLLGGDFNAAAQMKREAQRELFEAQRSTSASGTSGDLREAQRAAADAESNFTGPRWWMTLHMMLGSAAALVTVLVSSITITYFIGTARWCREVCETFHLSPELAEQSARLKRSTFPWALAAIATMILVVALGAAADPSGANWRLSAQLVMYHYVASMLAIVLVSAAFWVQAVRIAENYKIIEAIVAEVEQARAVRQLLTPEHTVA